MTAASALKYTIASTSLMWFSTREAVRAEVVRLEKELTAGLKKHQAAAERDADLAEFQERAAKGGTTVREALSKYVNLEDQLRADPTRGLEIICQNVGLSLREVGVLLGATPGQGQGGADSTHDRVNSRPLIPALRNCPRTSCFLSSRDARTISPKHTIWRNGSVSRPPG
jgi:hypothetical protein